MKKLYMKTLSILGIALLSHTVSAQDFNYAPSQERFDTVYAENYESFNIDIMTPTFEDITYHWELVSNTLDPNWSYSLCDYAGCYVGVPASGQMSPITASQAANGTTGFLKINLTVGFNYNVGQLKIYVYDAADYNRGDTITFNIVWEEPVLNIEEHALEVGLYPNPVRDIMTLDNKNDKPLNVNVMNAIGANVASFQVAANSIKKYDMEALNTGVYFVSYQTNKGNMVTKKVIKQ